MSSGRKIADGLFFAAAAAAGVVVAYRRGSPSATKFDTKRCTAHSARDSGCLLLFPDPLCLLPVAAQRCFPKCLKSMVLNIY